MTVQPASGDFHEEAARHRRRRRSCRRLAGRAAASAKPQRTTITDTVVALSGSSGFDANGGEFDILREAVLATGLDRTLSGRRQLTVFAPTGPIT